MFKSWALHADGQVRERKRSFDPETGKTSCPQACGHCRVKKVKCTGEKTGCKRCETLGRVCVYDQSPRGQNGAAGESASQQQGSAEPDVAQSCHQSPKNTTATGDDTVESNTEISDDPMLMAGEGGGAANTTTPGVRGGHQDTTPRSATEESSGYNVASAPMTICSAPSAADGFRMSEMTMPSDFNASMEDFFADTGGMSAGDYTVHHTMAGGPNTSSSSPSTHHLAEGVTAPSVLNFLDQSLVMEEVNSSPPFYYGPEHCSPMKVTMKPGHTFSYLPTPASSNLPLIQTEASCRCLQRIVLLMDEVEDMLGEDRPDPGKESPDMSLAAHKEAMRHVQVMLGCDNCTALVENMIIVTFLVAKLAQLCRRVSDTIATSGKDGGSVGSVAAAATATEGDRDMGIGGYKVESDEEYRVVVGGLLGLQLRRLNLAVRQLTQVSTKLESHAMFRRLGAVKRTLTSLLAKQGL